MSFGKYVLISTVASSGIALGVAGLGLHYADDAAEYQASLERLISGANLTMPVDVAAESPSGLLGKIFARHPNNEIVKGLMFAFSADEFAKAHPNNEVAKAATVLLDPQEFIAKHPNNQLAHTLQILSDTEGFYTGHSHNDLARTLHILTNPRDFADKHPSNDFGKAIEAATNWRTFEKRHPNNETVRVAKEIRRFLRKFRW